MSGACAGSSPLSPSSNSGKPDNEGGHGCEAPNQAAEMAVSDLRDGMQVPPSSSELQAQQGRADAGAGAGTGAGIAATEPASGSTPAQGLSEFNDTQVGN